MLEPIDCESSYIVLFKVFWECQKETHCFKFKESIESKMFKQFLKNWDDTFHEELVENQKRLSKRGKLSSSGLSLKNTLDDITLLRKIRNGSKSQSYMEINNNFQDNKTQINTLKSSVSQITFIRQSDTFTRRLGKNWKRKSQIETKDKDKPISKTNAAKFPTFKSFLMTRYNSQNV